ncbi:hypothetical protein RUND412_002730 [Rhizina undulata]
MPLLEPINLSASAGDGNHSGPVTRGSSVAAEDYLPSALAVPAPSIFRSGRPRPPPLKFVPGMNSLSRSDPPTPPNPPPPTPKRRGAQNNIAVAEDRGPEFFDPANSLSRRDPPTPPQGPPPSPQRRAGETVIFDVLSRRDPPTPPPCPPSSPNRRAFFNFLSRRDPPSPPRGPPPSPSRRTIVNPSSLSRRDPPSPPRGPPPSPSRRPIRSNGNAWSVEEENPLVIACRSEARLCLPRDFLSEQGLRQISALFNGKMVDECRSGYTELQHMNGDAAEESTEHDKQFSRHHTLQPSMLVAADADSHAPFLYSPSVDENAEDLVPGLSRGPTPMASPVFERPMVSFQRCWDLMGGIRCALHLQDEDTQQPKETRTNDEPIIFSLEIGDDWSWTMGRVQNQGNNAHEFSAALWCTAN